MCREDGEISLRRDIRKICEVKFQETDRDWNKREVELSDEVETEYEGEIDCNLGRKMSIDVEANKGKDEVSWSIRLT